MIHRRLNFLRLRWFPRGWVVESGIGVWVNRVSIPVSGIYQHWRVLIERNRSVWRWQYVCVSEYNSMYYFGHIYLFIFFPICHIVFTSLSNIPFYLSHSLSLYINTYISSLIGWGFRIHLLFHYRRVRLPPTNVLDMTLKNLMVRFQ